MPRLYPYKQWTKEELRSKVVEHINSLNIDPALKKLWVDLANEAAVSEEWDAPTDYNGCTALQDFTHPDPACFIHDYLWICGYGGRRSDIIFETLMLAQGRTVFSTKFRKFAVRVGWVLYFYWKYKLRGKLKPLTVKAYALYRYSIKTK